MGGTAHLTEFKCHIAEPCQKIWSAPVQQINEKMGTETSVVPLLDLIVVLFFFISYLLCWNLGAVCLRDVEVSG
jgi:hypothetical protein